MITMPAGGGYDRLLARQEGPPTVEWAKALYGASVMAGVQGDLPTGTTLVEHGRTLAAQTADPLMRAFVYSADGRLGVLSGDLDHARSRLESALAQFGARGDRTLEITALTTLGTA
ncbi:hypothetical protein [Rhodococcus sp. DMU1]|uniref:hypothetical protein n=1 Tax=Rhodococcus sp. DMU1 TaxID=2722825 RepID=UPI00143E0F6F|nr:hypothetical protein [Rhodococcus sp. DMU1]QIX53531.1 hypothetical protein HFP48_29280 [Rhodococcus sp. DMU1]